MQNGSNGHYPKLGNTNYTLPTAKNFRVHFTVSLYDQGMPIDFIEAIISHAFNSQTYDSYLQVLTFNHTI